MALNNIIPISLCCCCHREEGSQNVNKTRCHGFQICQNQNSFKLQIVLSVKVLRLPSAHHILKSVMGYLSLKSLTTVHRLVPVAL